jgi:hypothetical protein
MRSCWPVARSSAARSAGAGARARRRALRDGVPAAAEQGGRRRPATQISATGKHVVVIGGGDTGSDCVGTSNRHGAKSVTQFELMPMPPEQENKALTWPYWPTKLRTSSRRTKKAASATGRSPPRSSSDERQGHVRALRGVRLEWKDGGQMKMSEVPGSEFETARPTWCCSRWASSAPVARCSRPSASTGRARQREGDDRRRRLLRHQRAEGVRRRRHAPRPVAGGMGDPGRAAVRARGGRVPDGRVRPAARGARGGKPLVLVHGDQHQQAGGDAHERMRAESRRATAETALQADDAARGQRSNQPEADLDVLVVQAAMASLWQSCYSGFPCFFNEFDGSRVLESAP